MSNLSIRTIKTFRFWCQKVLPLVYDDSLSYYEVLCKVVDYMNNLIKDTNAIIEDMEAVKNAVDELNKFIENFDTTFAEHIIEEHLATMIFVSISDSGYFIYHIPESWKDIEFNTTGLDIELELQPEYGHLVLSY